MISENVQSARLEILKAFRVEVSQRFNAVEARLDRIEDVQREQRRHSAGMLVMLQATAGDCGERGRDVERRTEELGRRAG